VFNLRVYPAMKKALLEKGWEEYEPFNGAKSPRG